MTLECFDPGIEGASLCVSRSDTPAKPETWSKPVLPMEACSNSSDGGCRSDRYLSASTGVCLIDGDQRFFSWTVVDDGRTWFEDSNHQLNADEGDERTYSSGIGIKDFETYAGYVYRNGQELLSTEADVYCQSSWDCNNQDMQDWKREQGYYYAIYNGGNHYRCVRPESGNNQWALSVVRRPVKDDAIGPYNDALMPLVSAERNDICGISYPVINEVGGELYMYYAYYPSRGGNVMKRSKLLFQ